MYFKRRIRLKSVTNNRSIFTEIGKQIRTVLTEELMCRGVLLYILIKKIGQTKALFFPFIFAALYGLNSEIWGNGTQMILVFIFTFAMGLLLAYSICTHVFTFYALCNTFGWN